jgi:hypothetical protein
VTTGRVRAGTNLGAREVRKLQAEIAEIARRATEVLHEHQVAATNAVKKKPKKPQPVPRYRGVFGAPA